MAGELMAADMAEQPAVLDRLTSKAEEQARAVADVIPRPLAGIAFVARGSSDNAAVFGRYLAEQAAGRPAGLIAPSLYTRYGSRVDWRGYLLVALSQSGATPEIIATCRKIRAQGARVLGITNVADSELTRTCDLTLSTDAGPELAIPATKTVTGQMLIALTMARGLGWKEVGTEQLLELPRAVAAVLDAEEPITEIAERWMHLNRLVVAGRGLGYAAALECALKVKETTGILAEGISIADLLHGPITAVNAGAPTLLVDAGGPVAADLTQLRNLLIARGVDVITLPPSSALPEPLQVITAVVRGQQLARTLALLREGDPDRPPTLTKITLTT